jgi:serine protease AprX
MKIRIFFSGVFCLCFCLPAGSAHDGNKTRPALAPYADVRGQDLRGQDFNLALIRTLWFNEKTVWDKDDRLLAMAVMAQGKNPGLGVRSLHARGITGLGVNVAIIDQNLCLTHPEFASRIVKYRDMGCGQPATSGSMHGPAVTSLLAGRTIGTAPGARVYYAAAPSWKKDAQYYADALNWIIAENRLLAKGRKIRVVSVSAAPSGPGSPFTSNNAAWDQAVARAETEGLLVIDCTESHGWVETGYYNVDAPEDVTAASTGFPKTGPNSNCEERSVSAPNSFRTQAEEYVGGDFSYQYMGQGGLSWAVPYVAGVLALGWQVQPELDAGRLVKLLRGSAFVKNGCRIIDPPRFIEFVSEWPVYPPAQFSLTRLENNLIFFRETVNRLTWQANGADKTAAAKYRLFRRARTGGDDSWQLLIELAGDVFSYDDRGLGKDTLFTYAICTVSAHGVESDAATVEN